MNLLASVCVYQAEMIECREIWAGEGGNVAQATQVRPYRLAM